ncbi:MAG TPA: PilZ domain-containing protein [Kiritimatiellia bacterium]|nr:PilZ domain-containing protein [Kiritimatiellia bacterium]HSA19679.1 PilZ domain-containing protein [Kiritimatiellia bacterium]
MRIGSASPAKKQEPVSVFVCGDQPVEQPEGFRVCPLGVQFYSPRKIQEFQIMEFRVAIPGRKNTSEEIQCSGVVVHCKPLEGRDLFRIWIKFLDLPDSKRDQIRCMAKAGKHLCPYCENF